MKTLQSILIILMGLNTIVLAEATESSGDICYADIYTESMNFPSICMGLGGINCRNVIPIVNSSGEDISNVKVYLTSDGIMNASFNDDCGVKDNKGTCTNDSDHQTNSQNVVVGNTTILGYSYGYDLNDMTTDDQKDTYTESTISINFNNKKLYTTYTKDGKDYYSEVYPCGATGSSSYTTGPFDAWDTDSNISERVIKTEVTANNFDLIINSMNADNDDTETKNGIDVKYRLYDLNTSTAVTDWEIYDASSSEDGESETKSFTDINAAYRDVRVQFAICYITTTRGNRYTGYTTTTELHPLSDCGGAGEPPLDTSTFSTDNFAIRPYSLAAFGKNQYKRAGEDFNTTVKALTENDAVKLGNSDYAHDDKNTISGIVGYDANISDLSIVAQYYVPTSDEIDQMQTDTGATDVATCSNAGTFTVENTNDLFTNGELDASLNFSETGILDIQISEIPTKEWAIVDSDDTADSRRYITPSTITYDNEDISANILMLFVPYKLDTTVTYESSTAGQNWLYMNDINKSNSTFTTPQHAAYIKYKIVAKNKNGDTTKNYNKTCFPDVNEVNCPRVNGLKLNTTFDLFLDAKLSTTKDANVSFYTENNNSAAIWQPTKNMTLVEGNNTIREWVSPLDFTDGVGDVKLYFNIDRNSAKTRNPIVIRVIDANTSTSWMTNPGSPKEFNGTTLNEDKTFYYGRTHASRQIFTVNPGTDLIYYQVYCYGTGCDKSLLQNSTSLKTTDDPRWYVNSAHTALSGTVGNISVKNASTSTITSSVVEGSPAKADLTYNNDTYPYKATMLNATSKWLIYNKYDDNATSNEFEVEFINANSNWAGKKETDNTTNKKASDRTNRRTMW